MPKSIETFRDCGMTAVEADMILQAGYETLEEIAFIPLDELVNIKGVPIPRLSALRALARTKILKEPGS